MLKMSRALWSRLWALACAPYRAWQVERDLARQHQLALVREVVKGIEALTDAQAIQAKEQAASLTAIATANAAQAEAFSHWLRAFTTSAAPTASVVTEEDEWEDEQKRLASRYGLNPELLANLPEEFRLAHQLQQGILDIGNDD